MKLRIVSHHAHEREFHDGRLRKPKPHKVGVQISCGVHSQMSQKNAVCGTETVLTGSRSRTRRLAGLILMDTIRWQALRPSAAPALTPYTSECPARQGRR